MRIGNFFKRASIKARHFLQSKFKSRSSLIKEITNQQQYLDFTNNLAGQILERHDKIGARIGTTNANLSIGKMKITTKNALQKINATLNNELADKGIDKSTISAIQAGKKPQGQHITDAAINTAREAYLKEWETKFFQSDVEEYGEVMNEDRKNEVWNQIEANITKEFNDGWRPSQSKLRGRGTKLNRYNTDYNPDARSRWWKRRR